MNLQFVFWDVQHGSAAYIRTPNDTHMVVDLGTGSYGNASREFSPLEQIKKSGVRQLDYVILTHPHRDHIDDIFNFDALFPRVLHRPRHLTEEEVRAGNRSGDRSIVDKYLEINARYVHPIPAPDPTVADNNGGVRIQSFTPRSCDRGNLNNHSIVTVFSHAQSKLLLPGDNEPSSWEELLKQDDFRAAIVGTDIFVAPHHGRDSGFSELLFQFIKPKLTIISDGRFCDTSATDRYASKTSGWTVHKRSGGNEERKCVTTRSDGHIEVVLGMNEQNRFIQVKVF